MIANSVSLGMTQSDDGGEVGLDGRARRGVEDGDRAPLAGRGEGRGRHGLLDLELADDGIHALLGSHGRLPRARAGARAFAPGMMMMRLLPSASTQMGATPLEPGTRRTWAVSMPWRAKLARVCSP